MDAGKGRGRRREFFSLRFFSMGSVSTPKAAPQHEFLQIARVRHLVNTRVAPEWAQAATGGGRGGGRRRRCQKKIFNEQWYKKR